MQDLRPRPVHRHGRPFADDLSGTSPWMTNSCRRCAALHSWVASPQTRTFGSGLPARIAMRSLQADCDLCTQFRSAFERLNSLRQNRDPVTQLFLIWLPTGMSFDVSDRPRGDEFFVKQSIEFVYRTALRQTVALHEPDYQFIRIQLDICNKSHGQECLRPTPGSYALRVINCKSRHLVTANPGEPYACLSYVWGSGAMQETESFGDKLPADMPKTIEDAMAVAIALGISFLWVDRYCIDQENPQEKHRIIQNMNKIYEGAEITIIAALGDDPRHGLPGVRGTPRKPQLTLNLADETFVDVGNISCELQATKWANRGWTYQEMLLSRRRLVFTSTQMYFQCRKMHRMESLNPSFSSWEYASALPFRGFPSKGIGHTMGDLYRRLQEYYPRQLSFDTDIINAFDGIVNAFDESERFPFRVTHFYGVLVIYSDEDEHLAQRSFVSNLGWSLVGRPDGHAGETMRTTLFPSWSWASAKANSLQGRFSSFPSQFNAPNPWLSDEIEISLTHKVDGEMDVYAFAKHKDSYHMFVPAIKMTTWILQCPFRWAPDGVPVLLGKRLAPELQPSASCHALHLACVGIRNPGTISTLVLEEAEPGVFRRVGTWDAWITYDISDCNSACEILAKELAELQETPARTLWRPDEREVVSRLRWEKRAVTIV